MNIYDFIKNFSDKRMFYEKDILEIDGRLYVINPDLQKIKDNTKAKPYSCGIYLGRIAEKKKGKYFLPSSYLLEEIKKISNATVTLDDKASFLYTCGKNIFKSSIKKANIKKGYAIVVDKNNTVLGYGKVDMSKKIALQNVMDIGSFLRREKKQKKSKNK